MYGRIHYENEKGEFHTEDFATEAEYEQALERGCKWIEDEPRRPLGMWGERRLSESLALPVGATTATEVRGGGQCQ
jgi:hypothetical protein